jgi:CelD/BcsL family acetyltransferase involved in cellulose biosynthesis
MRARPWRGLGAFTALAGDWERLARLARLDPLCNAPAWLVAHARAWAPDEDVFGWVFEEGGAVLGIVALVREPRRGPLALRRALLLGDGSFDSDYLAPPIEPGREREVVALLFDAARAVPGLEALVLAGQTDDSPFLAAVRTELDARGFARREHALLCLATPLARTLEATLAMLKPRMRSKVRSAIRAAGERGARLEWCTAEAEREAWLAELYRLHELRWRAAGRPGAFADARRRAFYSAWSAGALARGELAFARLVETGGTVSAIQIGARVGERYYQIQEGFDPAREDLRAGTALRGLALEALIAQGVQSYDFMAGDSQHKRDWGAVPQPCTTIAFPVPRFRARLAYGLRAALDRWQRR